MATQIDLKPYSKMGLARLACCMLLAFLEVALDADAGAQQTTTGYCSPTFKDITGNVTSICYSTKSEWRQSIEDSLAHAISELHQLSKAQTEYLIPSIDDYISQPSTVAWRAVEGDVKMVRNNLERTVEVVIRYDSTLAAGMGQELSELHGTLHARRRLLVGVPSEPPTKQEAEEWASKYTTQMERLAVQLQRLQTRWRERTIR